MTRQELFDWVQQQYGTEPEYPWHDWNAVLRRRDNDNSIKTLLALSYELTAPPKKRSKK